jgi:DNA-binding NarL/FixJ family response regulator
MEQDSMHLSWAARQLNLNRREQEIVRLLVRGLGNKEIAFALGLSLNTIKGYMKLLMGKLNVRSRTEIVSLLLTVGPDLTNSFHQFPPSPQIVSPSLRLI